MRDLSSLCVVLVVLTVSVTSAQIVGGRQIVKAELVGGRLERGQPYTVGVHFNIEPGWYLYWKNPGDAGLPIEVQWNLPDGWMVGALKFPVPSKFVHDDIVAYGYEREVTLFANITPTGVGSGVVRASLDWLVCKESCVRGKATVSLEDYTGKSDGLKLLSSALERLPEDREKLRVSFGSPIMRQADRSWTCEVVLEGNDAKSVTDFYPYESKGVFLDYSSIRIAGDRLVFTLSQANNQVESAIVSGLLIAGGKGYEYSIPIRFSSF